MTKLKIVCEVIADRYEYVGELAAEFEDLDKAMKFADKVEDYINSLLLMLQLNK